VFFIRLAHLNLACTSCDVSIARYPNTQVSPKSELGSSNKYLPEKCGPAAMAGVDRPESNHIALPNTYYCHHLRQKLPRGHTPS
jgi:hypothetical protein